MVKVICLIILAAQVKAFSQILNNIEEDNRNEKQFHEDLLRKLFKQKSYNGILIYNEGDKSEYCRKFVEYFKFQQIPTITITEYKNFSYSDYFNNKIMCVVCVNSFYGNILQQLADLLHYMRFSRILAIMNKNVSSAAAVKDFFQHAQKLKMLNIALIFEDFYSTRELIQYTIFPKFTLEWGVYQLEIENMGLYPQRLLNLQGYRLRTIADHTEPRAMEYYNERQVKVINGYIGRFVQAISKTLNATLYFPLNIPPEVQLDYRIIMDYVINNSLDIPISSVSLYGDVESRDYSYPFEMAKWCLLLPVENTLEWEEIFYRILHSPIIVLILGCILLFTIVFNLTFFKEYTQHRCLKWPQMLVNDIAIRGVLGQAFASFSNQKRSLKLIYIMLLLSGITNLTIFTAYLQSLLTQPPFQPRITTYQDLFRSPIKVAIAASDKKLLHALTNGSLSYLNPKFHTIDSFVEFSHFRDKFDPHFAYFTISSKLFYYNDLQDYHGKRVFRFSTDLCPNPLMQLKFPLGPNSIFRKRFDNLIMRSLESGLMYYWISKSFADMQASGREIQLNRSHPEMAEPLAVDDLYWIWLYFILAISLSFVVFLLELLVNKVFCN